MNFKLIKIFVNIKTVTKLLHIVFVLTKRFLLSIVVSLLLSLI